AVKGRDHAEVASAARPLLAPRFLVTVRLQDGQVRADGAHGSPAGPRQAGVEIRCRAQASSVATRSRAVRSDVANWRAPASCTRTPTRRPRGDRAIRWKSTATWQPPGVSVT